MLRRVIAGLFLVGLAIGVWLLWPEGQDGSASTTAALASDATTTTETVAPTTSPPDASTNTTRSAEDHVVKTVEEAEGILRELWFGWFDGIYHQDENRIREVVATEEFLEDGIAAFGNLNIKDAPTPEDVVFRSVEILRSDHECLVIWSDADLTSLRGEGSIRQGVDVLRRVGGEWKMATAWVHTDDLWEQDCEALLRPLP